MFDAYPSQKNTKEKKNVRTKGYKECFIISNSRNVIRYIESKNISGKERENRNYGDSLKVRDSISS